MTDRTDLMHSMEELVRSMREYHERGLLESVEAVLNYAEGWVHGAREAFNKDNEEGRYGT